MKQNKKVIIVVNQKKKLIFLKIIKIKAKIYKKIIRKIIINNKKVKCRNHKIIKIMKKANFKKFK